MQAKQSAHRPQRPLGAQGAHCEKAKPAAGRAGAPATLHPLSTAREEQGTQQQGRPGKGLARCAHLDVLLCEALLHGVRHILPDAV